VPRVWVLQVREVRLHVDGSAMLRRRHHRERRGAQEDGADHWSAARQGRPRLPPARRQQARARGQSKDPKSSPVSHGLKDFSILIVAITCCIVSSLRLKNLLCVVCFVKDVLTSITKT
jgi:hypothetical protein